VIIKSKRIAARGQALKRTLAHVCDGEDNDELVLVRGNIADLEDWRSDALRFGRQYCARHWIVSPAQDITEQQLDELIERLALEFGFDPKRILAWRHTKPRANEENGCPRHFHILVPEVDPIDGRVMASSHDWDKQSKLARVFEVRWGHNIVAAPRMSSIVAALEREGDYTTVAALRGVVPPDHPASFDETDHQRAKRSGVDLPRVREMVALALASATSHGDFDAKLASIGLRLRAGDEKDVLVVETTDGTFVGSLARLTRLRKAALKERMKFNATGQSTPQTDHPRSHVFSSQAAVGADGAHLEASDGHRSSRPAAPDGHHDRALTGNRPRDREHPRPAGKSGSPAGRTNVQEAAPGRHSWLRFAAGCIQYQSTLLDLLGAARRSARPPFDRTLCDLNDIIEAETLAMNRTASLKEPASLHAARQKFDEDAARLRLLEAEADEALHQLTEHRPRSAWHRLLRPSHNPERQALEARFGTLQRAVVRARGDRTMSGHTLKAEEKKFQTANARHQSEQSARCAQASHRISTARAARVLIEKNPPLARWGVMALMRLAANIWSDRTDSRLTDAPVDWDLLPTYDLWGIPLLPRPKAP